MSVWSLGEGHGYRGQEMEPRRVTCAFCLEKGNWELTNRETKRKPNSSKAIHFDTYRCGNCGGFVMVVWSAEEFGNSLRSLYNFWAIPKPRRVENHPDWWPDEVGRCWVQAKRSVQDESWDAALLMGRSTLQAVLRDKGADPDRLWDEIEQLGDQGFLPPNMKAWAHELRDRGNISAHPGKGEPPPEPQTVRELVRFIDLFLTFVYDLPRRIEQMRLRDGEADD